MPAAGELRCVDAAIESVFRRHRQRIHFERGTENVEATPKHLANPYRAGAWLFTPDTEATLNRRAAPGRLPRAKALRRQRGASASGGPDCLSQVEGISQAIRSHLKSSKERSETGWSWRGERPRRVCQTTSGKSPKEPLMPPASPAKIVELPLSPLPFPSQFK
ncbi:unnamed protein product [Pleuronectes platessa]|uniref:Uncharacterized protein n=1 Tax=Pleuronectes platessa TaxID=8262 RepID=A0A9N7VPD4_PLEPL|nr:unnamed protein product [Pleuronectes platessa]